MAKRSLKDRVKDVIGQYGPTVVAQLAVEVWSNVARCGPACKPAGPQHAI